MNNTNTATNDSEINTLSALTEADQEGYDQFVADLDRQCDEWDAAHQPDEQDDDSDDDDDEHGFNREPREDNFRDDVDADANTLASAGWGTDEDYGYFGEDNGWD